MGPCGVHFFFLVDTGLGEIQIAFLHVWQRSENILLDHLHDFVEVGDDDAHDVFLVLEHLLKFCNSVKALSLAFDVLLLIFIIICLHAHLKLLDELLL